MSALVARLLTFRQELAIEIQRFILLWRYQHPVLPFTLWWRLVLKRCFDFMAALIGSVVAIPLIGLIALAVRLDSKGPIFYSQERLGRFGEPFTIWKFRTMHKDAEEGGPVWAKGDKDPRVTPLGRFLRRIHLDELPQIWNVIKGDMSLVGPRPERACFVEMLNQEVPRYDERFLIKPGITGLAQVHYRYDQTVADVKRKLRFDLLYVKRMCLMLDARILAWTLLVVVTGRGIK
ncbi:MAG: sugar transferase [Candidatus Omnitrophica bacterium]|nr:sugar transferase [Candidatus Omnitrophota bacterium]MBI3010821.1 sugar transferase [Candidatus Omnitrophota bacterium]